MGFRPGWEWLLVLLVIVVLFGAKRLPDASRSLGRSMRILKSEVKGMKDDDAAADASKASAATPPATRTTAEVEPPVRTVTPTPAPDPVSPPATGQSRQP